MKTTTSRAMKRAVRQRKQIQFTFYSNEKSLKALAASRKKKTQNINNSNNESGRPTPQLWSWSWSYNPLIFSRFQVG